MTASIATTPHTDLPDPAVRRHATLLAAVLALLVVALGWRGEDWPAQLYRAELFRRVGFVQWDNGWFGGHYLPRYSVLFPPLGGILGVTTVVLLSSAAATWAFADIATRVLPQRSQRLAVRWFAVGSVTNVLVGRATFALGLAFALAAVAALVRGSRWAVAGAVLASLASPVAGVFVALGAGTSWLVARRWLPALTGAAALAPLAVLSVLFPEGGRFPYRGGHFTITLGVCAALLLFAPRRWSALRVGVALYALAAVAIFVVPNPLGGNWARLAMFVGGPLLAGALWPTRRALFVLLAVPFCIWQWQPAYDSVVRGGHDPSSQAEYFEPLLDFVGRDSMLRIEIPFTERHWETRYVAPHVALARGWERQADIEANAIFYADELHAADYLAWLEDNAVSYVALPDVDLDHAAVAEAGLLRSGVPGLELVWQNANWRVWKVLDTRPMVEGPADLVHVGADSFTVRLHEPGSALVRIRHSAHWTVDEPGCVAPAAGGWTLVSSRAPAEIEVRQSVGLGTSSPERCPR